MSGYKVSRIHIVEQFHLLPHIIGVIKKFKNDPNARRKCLNCSLEIMIRNAYQSKHAFLDVHTSFSLYVGFNVLQGDKVLVSGYLKEDPPEIL